MRVYQVNKCSDQIQKTIFETKQLINITSKIFDGKNVIIGQELHDYLINYFENILNGLSKVKLNQKYILVTDVVRMAQDASAFINNLEKRTKVKVYDKTSDQTIDMVSLSILNRLKKQNEDKSLLNDSLTLFNLTKRKILLKKIPRPFRLEQDFLLQQFSSITLEKFIKKDIFQWGKLSLNKSTNPVGKTKINKIIETYLAYLPNKIPDYFLINKNLSQFESKTKKKYVSYTNQVKAKQKLEYKDSLIITGDTLIESIKALKIRGSWIRRDHLKNKILSFASKTDSRIPSKDPRYTVINLVLLYGHMTVLGFDRAFILPSSFEEGFLLHPEYH